MPKPVWLDKHGPLTRTDFRVVVENLSSHVSWQDLKDYLRQAGEVTYADAHKPRRNEGCVEFASERVSFFSPKNDTYFYLYIKLFENMYYYV